MNTEYKINEIVRATVGQVREVAPTSASDKKPARQERPVPERKEKEPVAVSTNEEVKRVAKEVQAHLSRLDTDLKIEVVDNEDKEVVVKVVDPETKDVIRQIPSEEIMAIRDRMRQLVGILYDVKT